VRKAVIDVGSNSVLLLVAVIGAMVLARRSISGERNPNLEDSQFIRKLPGA